MTCRLIGAKPLFEPMLVDRQLDRYEQTSAKFKSQFTVLHGRKWIWKCRVQYGGHFVPGLNVLKRPTREIQVFLNEPLQWRHNERDGVSNHQPHDRLLKYLFRRRSKKTSKLRVTGLCEGNSPVTGEFPAQRASNAEHISIWWRHHAFYYASTMYQTWLLVQDISTYKSSFHVKLVFVNFCFPCGRGSISYVIR